MNDNSNSISEYVVSKDALNIDYLKKKSIEYLHEICGNKWTDFNLHDPGVTSLEIICLAINELVYRSNFNIEDIISLNTEEIIDSYITSEKITRHNPLTHDDVISDLNKCNENIINLRIKENHFLEEYSGIYDLFIETTLLTIEEKKQLLNDIKSRVCHTRNICTVYEDINFFKYDLICCNVSVEIKEKVEPSKILFDISKKLDELCITTENLDDNQYVYISDIISSIMDINEISTIQDVKLKDINNKYYNWRYKAKENTIIKINHSQSILKITYKNNVLFNSSLSQTVKNFDKGEVITINDNNQSQNKKNISFKPYTSIQHDFPNSYGIGSYGISKKDKKIKKGSVKQLKGFIYIFDQILSNSFEQLNQVNKIFSFNNLSKTKQASIIKDFPSLFLIYKPFLDTYFLKNFNTSNIEDMERSWSIYYKKNKDDIYQSINNTVETENEFIRRRNQILNHILARFGFNIKVFETVSQLTKKELISYKLNLLQNISELTNERSLGIRSVKEEIFSKFGVKNYLYSLLGLRHTCMEYITDFSKLDKEVKDTFKITFPHKNTIAIKKLFKYGRSEVNYNRLSKNTYKLKLDNQEYAKIECSNNNISLKEIIQKVKKIDKKSEGLYIVEHLLLKPASSYRVFNFEFEINNNKIFISKNYNRKNRNDIINKFINSIEKENFRIIEKDINQYIISWQYGKFKLEGREYFNDKSTAISAIRRIVEKKDNSNFSIEDCITTKTKYYNIYNEYEDPFSNIITIIIPNWSSRLQNHAFKSYIEETILKELPAHIVSYIKWVDIEQMSVFESKYKHYQKSLLQKDLNKKENALDNLLQNLIS